MSVGKVIAGIVVFACLSLIFVFTLKSLLNEDAKNAENGSVSSAAAMETAASAATAPAPAAAPQVQTPPAETAKETVKETASTEEASTEEASTEAAPPDPDEALKKLNMEGFDPDEEYFDTMADGTKPEKDVKYVVETIKDIQEFWDNGEENYAAFKNFMIKGTRKNENDLMCDYFVDIMFKDGSSLEGLRCNNVEKLTEKARFRYGYVMDDSTWGNGQNVMYLYLVQE